MATLKKPLRKNVALSIDGGGIKGVMVARALVTLEQAVGKPITEIFKLTSGTSTGAIISSGLARGLDAQTILDLYMEIGPKVFAKSWRTLPVINVLVDYQYEITPMIKILKDKLGEITIGELHQQRPDFHMVLTTTDMFAAETRFIKLYKERFADWKLREAAQASCIVPTIFPIYQHEYKKEPDDPPDQAWIPSNRYWLDGGVGSYANPAYMAAYEAAFCLKDQGWDMSNTTLISIGTGIDPAEIVWKNRLRDVFGLPRTPNQFLGPEWAYPTIEIFLHEADQQQLRFVRHFFTEEVEAQTGKPDTGLDFRRFNVHFKEPIAMDSAQYVNELVKYGEQLGQMIVDNIQTDIGDFTCGGPMVFKEMEAKAKKK